MGRLRSSFDEVKLRYMYRVLQNIEVPGGLRMH